MSEPLLIRIDKDLFGGHNLAKLSPSSHRTIIWHALRNLSFNPVKVISDATIASIFGQHVFAFITPRDNGIELRHHLALSQITVLVSGTVGPVPNDCNSVLQDVFRMSCPTVTIQSPLGSSSAKFYVPESDLNQFLTAPALMPGTRLRFRQRLSDSTLKDITPGSSSSSRANSTRSSPIVSPTASQTLSSRHVSPTLSYSSVLQAKSLSNTENMSKLSENTHTAVSEQSESEPVHGDTESESDTRETLDQPRISVASLYQDWGNLSGHEKQMIYQQSAQFMKEFLSAKH
jgi:hypothetical protein